MSNKDFFVLKDVSGRLELTLKDRVKLLLLRLGRSQNWLADQTGVSKGSMSKFVNGQWGIPSQIKIRMAEVLECDSLVLFGSAQYFEDYKNKISYEVGKW